MRDKIDSGDITIQVESSKEDIYVPNGLAVSRGLRNISINPGYTPVTALLYGEALTLPRPPGGGATSTVLKTVETWTVDNLTPGWGAYSNGVWTITAKCRLAFEVNFLRSEASPYIYRNDEIIFNGAIGSSGPLVKTMVFASFDVGDTFHVAITPFYILEAGQQGKLLGVGSYPNTDAYDPSNMIISFASDDWQQNPYIYVYSQVSDPNPSGPESFNNTISYRKTGRPKVAEMTASTEIETERVTVGYTTNGSPIRRTEIVDYFTTVVQRRGGPAGPVLMQSRFPVPVLDGDQVNFSGSIAINRTGSNMLTDTGAETGVDIRFSIWGVGIIIDEYGVESMNPIELMFYQANLQPVHNKTSSLITFTMPTIPNATIPSWVDAVYMTVSYVDNVDQKYSTGTLVAQTTSGQNEPVTPPGTPSKRVVTTYLDQRAFRLHFFSGNTEIDTYIVDYSGTGVAFKNRSIYKATSSQMSVTLVGLINGYDVDIYEYDYETSTRGNKITTLAVPPAQETSIELDLSSDAIEIVSASDFYVNDVRITPTANIDFVETSSQRIYYTNITDDISKISIINEDGAGATATIDFCSANLDPNTSDVLQKGRNIRIMGRHYGEEYESRPPGWTGEAEYDEIFTGVIRSVRSEYDYLEDEPIIQIIAYNGKFEVENEKKAPVFDNFYEYGPVFNKLGVDVLHNGFNWGGKRGKLPDPFLFFPPSYGSTLWEALLTTRNTVGGYCYFNRKNQLVVIDEDLSDIPELVFTDGTLPGDISYGNLKMISDTSTWINKVDLEEQMIDYKAFKNAATEQGKHPPQFLRYPATKTQTATFKDEGRIEKFDEASLSLSVVRGTGSFRDIIGNKFGDGFSIKGNYLLNKWAENESIIDSFSVPIKSSRDIYFMSRLDLISNVNVVYKGDIYECRVLEIEHTITPGHWHVELFFKPKPGSVWW